MDTMPHHPHINEMGKRCHKRVCAGIAAVFDNTAADIDSCLVIEQSDKMVLGICDFTFHLFIVPLPFLIAASIFKVCALPQSLFLRRCLPLDTHAPIGALSVFLRGNIPSDGRVPYRK